MSSKYHALATLNLKKNPVLVDEEAGWAAQPNRTLRRHEKSLDPVGIRNQDTLMINTIIYNIKQFFRQRQFCFHCWNTVVSRQT